jgi:hypothetical protein
VVEAAPQHAIQVRSRRPTVSEWLLWGVVAAICVMAIRHDFRRDLIAGDQASHLLQALSLAYDFDLKYDAGDMARWETIGWKQAPAGLLYQTYSGGAAFAKPYIYSAVLAPFIRLTGVRFGVALVDSAVFVLLILVSLKTALLYFDRTVAPLVIAAFFLASNTYLYVFVIHPDLFHALLTACFCYAALRHFRSSSNRLVCLMAVLLAICVSEKFSMLFLLLPVFIWALKRAACWRVRSLAVILCAVTFGLCLLPYLHYSDYKSWNAYGGTRFYNTAGMPVLDPAKLIAKGAGTVGYEKFPGLHAPIGELLRSAWSYVFGAYTGVFIFAPATLLFGIASCCAPGRRAKISPWAAGIGLMVLSYLIFSPFNYFGGGQSVGNRWFLKAIPVAMALTLEAQLDLTRLTRLAVAALALSLMFIYPHHIDPVHAYLECTRSGWLQRWFPLEINQTTAPIYVGGKGNPVNISWFPRPPRWYVNLPGEPELWLWKNGAVVRPKSIVLYQHEYFKLEGGSFFALLDKSERGAVYATYHLGRAGQFRSSDRKASLLVHCETRGMQVKVIPLGHASRIKTVSGDSEQHFALPVKLELEPEQPSPDRFYKIDFSGDDNFWFFTGDMPPPDSVTAQRVLMR